MELLEFNDIFLSFLRWLIGLTIGCFLGFSLAIFSGLKFSNIIIRVLIDFLRAIPIIGLVPVVQMNVGVNEYGKIGLIAWAVIFPVWLTVRSIMDKRLENAELTLKAAKISAWSYYKLFVLPKLMGGFIKAIELAIGIAWLAVVAAEWVGTFTQGFWAGGLGYKLILGYNLSNWKMVYINLFVFGLLGLTTAYLWRLLPGLLFSKVNRLKGFNPSIKEVSTI